jgi:hypothetical protein
MNYKYLEEILYYFYQKHTCKVFGLNKRIGLYRFYECQQPNIQKAREYLNSLEK